MPFHLLASSEIKFHTLESFLFLDSFAPITTLKTTEIKKGSRSAVLVESGAA